MTIPIKLVITTLLLTFSFASKGQQYVVLESSNETYLKGKILNTAVQITLDENAELTVISEHGKLIKIKGPYKGSIGKDVTISHEKNGVKKLSSLIDSLSMLLMENQKERLGATRSLDGTFTKDEIINVQKKTWAIDINTIGDQCSTKKQTLLWNNNSKATSIFLKKKSEDNMVTVSWKAKDVYSKWPKTIQKIDKQTYQLIVSGDYQVKEITLHLLDVQTNSERINQALWMTNRGCNTQARLLLSSIEADQVIEKHIKH